MLQALKNEGKNKGITFLAISSSFSSSFSLSRLASGRLTSNRHCLLVIDANIPLSPPQIEQRSPALLVVHLASNIALT
jgi:fatty acid-binding protein DegV